MPNSKTKPLHQITDLPVKIIDLVTTTRDVTIKAAIKTTKIAALNMELREIINKAQEQVNHMANRPEEDLIITIALAPKEDALNSVTPNKVAKAVATRVAVSPKANNGL